jgi:hypothetical protein
MKRTLSGACKLIKEELIAFLTHDFHLFGWSVNCSTAFIPRFLAFWVGKGCI